MPSFRGQGAPIWIRKRGFGSARDRSAAGAGIDSCKRDRGDRDRNAALFEDRLHSPGLLRMDPTWAPLRGDARFRKLADLER